METVVVLIRNQALQYEGLRTSLGLLLEDLKVQMFVLDHKIAVYDEAYSDNLGFFEEMGGAFYSNNSENVEKYNFLNADNNQITAMLKSSDLIIPF